MNRPPAMHRILGDERVAPYETVLGRETIKRAAEEVIGRARVRGDGSAYDTIVDATVAKLERLVLTSLGPVINATGIVLHTNLGRAPMAEEALAQAGSVSAGYSNLELDLQSGERGSRYTHAAALLRELTGAEDALVVNNCAAAVLLVLDALAKGREVLVARSELVEIGGGFRVPDVLERSGATLVEAGTTNRVYVEDFERALTPRTSLILRTHPSNYRLEGFVHAPEAGDLARLARRAGVPIVEDLGSGALVDLAEFGAAHERTVQEAIADGVDLVTFSGDKLLGGPQAGIIAGRAPLLARLRNNPMLRALRVGKMTLAALTATLESYRDGTWRQEIPIYRMLGFTIDDLRRRASAFVAAIAKATIVESGAYVGGGSLPQSRISSLAVALTTPAPQRLAAALRRAELPIVARIENDRLLLDLRTIAPEEDATVIAALNAALA